MRFVIEQSAGPGARFASNAFASQVGKTIPVEVAPGQHKQGTVRSAKVVDDGAKARIEVEVPDSEQTKALFDTGISRHNVGFRR